jgi:hypothetical protein
VGSAEEQKEVLKRLGIVSVVASVIEIGCLVVCCGVFRCLLPEKQSFWHDDFTYRQRASAFQEMKEESELEKSEAQLAHHSSEETERSMRWKGDIIGGGDNTQKVSH